MRARGGLRTGRSSRRADIQALRGVAVALVVLYHAFPGQVPGGYIGVDVFFVISGYLITERLMCERGSLRPALGAFYARRIRRVLPAGILVLVATLIMARLALPPLAMPPIAGDAKAVALFYPNLHFAAQQTTYLRNLAPSPLLHYWSLGVEEQFYLLWPALMLACAAATSRRRAVILMVVIVVGSLLASILLTPRSASWSFFALHTRAWEFAVGGLLAACQPRLRQLLLPLSGSILTCGGFALILVAARALGPTTEYPGWAAMLPAGGAALVIVGGFASTPLIDRVLSIYPLQRTGDVSYSLYLWHWPLLVLFVPATGGRLTKVSLVALAYVLAVITYELVEQPPRRLIKSPARTYQFGGALIAVGLVAAYGAARLPRLNAGIAVRDPPGVAPAFAPEPGFVPSNLRPPLDRAAKDFAPLFVRCSASFEPSIPRLCGAGTIAPRRTMVVFGDSHAAQWVGPLAQIARTRGWSLENLTKADCPASEVRVFVITPLNGEYHACDAWRARAISVIARLKPALTVVSSARSYGYPGVPRSAFRARVEAGLLNTLRMVARAGPVLSLADTPQFRSSRPVCLSGQLHDPASCGAPARVAADPGYTALERRAAAAAGVDFADLNSVICPAGACDPIHGNLLIYADNNHLTATFVDALEPELAAVVKSALTARTRTRVHAASGVQIMHSSIMRPNTVTLRHPSS